MVLCRIFRFIEKIHQNSGSYGNNIELGWGGWPMRGTVMTQQKVCPTTGLDG